MPNRADLAETESALPTSSGRGPSTQPALVCIAITVARARVRTDSVRWRVGHCTACAGRSCRRRTGKSRGQLGRRLDQAGVRLRRRTLPRRRRFAPAVLAARDRSERIWLCSAGPGAPPDGWGGGFTQDVATDTEVAFFFAESREASCRILTGATSPVSRGRVPVARASSRRAAPARGGRSPWRDGRRSPG